MAGSLGLDRRALAAFDRDPTCRIAGRALGARFSARLAITDYAGRVSRHYGVNLTDLPVAHEFEHFGVVIEFDSPVELPLHDDERVLEDGLRGVIGRYGPVIIRNAYLPTRHRAQGQRNIFQSLKFHLDRGATQPDRYSLFTRDPFDPVQRSPRRSSTLVLANAVAYLQARKEGHVDGRFKTQCRLFEDEDLRPLTGALVLEHPWSAREGTGELSILHNDTVLHASYYRRKEDRGYPIGVRYLF